MKFVLLLIAAASATTLRQLSVKDRIAETPKPYLIPDVMKVDQDTGHALCNGTNGGACREAGPYLKKDAVVPPRAPSINQADVDKGLKRW